MKISGFSNAEIAAELKTAVLYRDYENPVKQISEILGLSARTIYDYFDGNIKISLPFLHACLIVTGGDPDVKKYLCPEGWDIAPSSQKAPTKNVEKECGDIHIAVSDLVVEIRKALEDGKITPDERAGIEKKFNNSIVQMNEVKDLMEEAFRSRIKVA